MRSRGVVRERFRLFARIARSTAFCVAALTLAACAGGRTAAGTSFEAGQPGVLTVATAFITAPGFWEGSPPTAGFEAGLAAALARRLGLDRVRAVQVPFAAIVKGDLGGADIALSQLTPTAERERSVDFTTPYLSAPPGVLAIRGAEAADERELRDLRWVVSSLSTLTPIVMHRIRPSRPPIVVEDRAQALQVLHAHRADALLLDLPVALGLARSDPRLFHVLGQLSGEEGLAAALPNGSRNGEIVDSAIRRLTADGTIARLASRWLGTGEDVPLILTEE
jgi:polar amino acid transport system substrate-binding protein